MSIPELDLNFHSYCSVYVATTSNLTASEFNPFADGSYSSEPTKKIVKTPDITYDSTTGRISFGASGTYFVTYSGGALANSTSTAVIRIKHNDADVLVTTGIRTKPQMSPKVINVNCMVTVQAGDNITATFDGTSANNGTTAGTHITAIKTNSHYAGAYYTADATEQTSTALYPIYDTANEGGTVASNTSGINYSGANGGFTVTADGTYLLFSTFIADVSGNEDYDHTIKIDSTTVDDLSVGTSGLQAPACWPYAMIVSADADEIITINTHVKVDPNGGFTIKKGTGVSILDISNNDTLPSALLSLTLVEDTDAFGTSSGDKDIFEAGNTTVATFAVTNHITAAGITYNQTDGTFTVAQSGDYLVMATFGLADTTTSHGVTLKITIDDTVYYSVSYETRTNAAPNSFPVCLVVSLEAGEALNFLVNDAGAKVADGSSVSIVRLDEVGGSRDLFAESTPVDEIADDFTINSFNKDTSDRQYGRLVEQVPMKLGVRGGISLRGRRVASTTAPSTEKGNKD